MNNQLIINYLNKLKKEDIISFSLKQNIILSNNELDIIYDYLKNDYLTILNNPDKVFTDIKDKVSNEVYNKILELYNKYKILLN